LSDSNPIDPRSFRNALGAFTTGVTIVTTRDADGNDIGLTANSFNSVSLDPPLVLWSLAKTSLSLKAFIESKFFAVHILAADQQPLSDLFARRGADKFAGRTLKRGHGDVPLLEGCSARFECETAFRHDGGDHEIFVGRVITFEHFPKPPLVFMGGKYAVALHKPTGISAEIADESGVSHDSLNYLISNAHFLLQQKMRPLWVEHRLNQAQIYALSMLGESAPQSVKQLDQTLEFTGYRLLSTDIQGLIRRGYLRDVGDERYALTDAGQALLIESAAVFKAAEEDAQRELDFNETQILRQLLKRLVRGMFRPLKKSDIDKNDEIAP
jgi:3-hydroxy-9,10-secoandrosta-1,3,5(10)-triene-9,17-dione monooxygenase reductase component